MALVPAVLRSPIVLTFNRIHLSQVKWRDLDAAPDRSVFQSRPWLTHLAETVSGDPVVASITRDGQIVGYFTGLIVKRFGLRILGSPFRGWYSDYMGFNLLSPEVSRLDALEGLFAFAFNGLNCHHVEIMDRRISKDQVEKRGYHYDLFGTREIDLSSSEDELLSQMRKDARYYIRKAQRQRHVVIESVEDAGFAEEYYAQLRDVFARQNLTPPFDLALVQSLISHLQPSGHLLLLRAKNREGKCVATGIFPACNDTATFWGGASWRDNQKLHPNEPLLWHAIQYWKRRGIDKFDMGGMDYKRKFGGYPLRVPWIRKSRNKQLEKLRNAARRLHSFFKRFRRKSRFPRPSSN